MQTTGKDWEVLKSWLSSIAGSWNHSLLNYCTLGLVKLVKCLQAETNLWVLPTIVLVKGCLLVSIISSPNVDGESRFSLYEALTQLLCWALPLGAQWGETSHEACPEESTAHVFSPDWVHYQFCTQGTGQRANGKIISSSSFQLPNYESEFFPNCIEEFCISYSLLMIIYRLYWQVVYVRF